MSQAPRTTKKLRGSWGVDRGARKMNSLKKQIQIKATLEKIWAILADVTRTPEWVDGVKESERTGAVREGKGMRWRENCVLDRQHIEVEHEMKVWEPMKKAVIQSVLPMNGSMTRTLAFTAGQEGVEVSVEFLWDLGIAGMLLGEAKVRNILDQSFSNTLANWKDLAEKK
jgi:carbon monoxide dehydrogenase subunit G